MIIKKLAFGNNDEAYIESNFSNGLNIIFSNENNRGKTLVMQGLLYSIGNEGIFPSGFNNSIYYFYTKILIGDVEYEFLRKGNSIIVKSGNNFNSFNTISDFKHFFNKNIYELPKIIKNGSKVIVELTMFYELFFLGQDNRDTSNLIVKGHSKKEDFLNMIYSLKWCNSDTELVENITKIKEQKVLIETNIKKERKKMLILKENPTVASYATNTGSTDDFEYVSKHLYEINNRMSELKKKLYREENRRMKLESLISELNSLNRQIQEGKVICSDCGSNKITYLNGTFEFDVTNTYIKNTIVKSIEDNISIKNELIESYKIDINTEQIKLQNLIKSDITPDIKDYILFDNEIKNAKELDLIIQDLTNDLNSIKASLKSINDEVLNKKEEQKVIMKEIIEGMKEYYSLIDKDGKLEISNLFTKKGITYSGSEGQEYYFCRAMSLNKNLGHNFPIIIDGFREGEVSTKKEQLMLKEFLKINKQVILTSTLKDEEFEADKYYDIDGLNAMDYSKVENSKILNKKYLYDFLSILDTFHIKL